MIIRSIVTDLDKSLAFMHQLSERMASRRVPFAHGTALFRDEFPLVWDLNYLRVERPAAAEEIAAEAERLHGEVGHRHRKVEPAAADESGRLRPDFEALGWETSGYLVMVHRRPPDRRADTSGVREVPESVLQPARERIIRAEPWADSEEVVRQILGSQRLLDGATHVRRFAALAGSEVASYCDLYRDGPTAQIEAVGTAPEHRNRGHARAVVTKALEEARAAGCDHVFLVADPDDWPKELYRKLGFDDAGYQHWFQLTPKTVVERLLADSGASRVTLREDVPGDFFPVTHEALAEGVKSIKDGAGIDLRGQPVARVLAETRAQVVQHDCATAFDDPDFHRMRAAYGGLASQIVTPIIAEGRLAGILSLHHCGEPRTWTAAEIGLAAEASERARRLIAPRAGA